jgi:hypothetical protein
MPQGNGDAEIRALQVVIDALEPLDDEARGRVLEYTLKRLGMRDLSTSSAAATPPQQEEPVAATSSQPSSQPADIRSLREAKQPKSAVEMAAVVAYYLSEGASAEERRDSVTTADIEKYFKQAQYRLPQRMDMTLHNGVAAGYFDRTGRGEFRLNPVGFNLVTHTLPRAAGQTGSRPPTRKRPTQKASGKNPNK